MPLNHFESMYKLAQIGEKHLEANGDSMHPAERAAIEEAIANVKIAADQPPAVPDPVDPDVGAEEGEIPDATV